MLEHSSVSQQKEGSPQCGNPPANSQDLQHLDMFQQGSHSSYHSQGPPGVGLRPMNSQNPISGIGSPWSDEPVKGDLDFTVPQCYYAKQAPVLNQRYFSKFQLNTLFYIFYSMPQDEAQLYAANELYTNSYGWL